ncbi:MAG: hypothetical protein Q4F67_06015 [Propionibacteriaceae bacterium]|nr:hypothetical protein [Propionibacteriaceae bacterium]
MSWPVDPLRERDLPNSERMLTRILASAAGDGPVEELDDLDAPARRPQRWLHAVAAAAVVIALASVGWVVSRPDPTEVEPGQRPTAPVVTATPTPTPSPTTATRPATEGVPAPAGTRPATVSRTPTPTPDPTPTPTPSPTASPSASLDPPRIYGTSATRTGSSRSGYETATVEYTACPGSLGARLYGPWISGATTVLAGAGELSEGGTLVNRNTCIPLTIEVEVPEAVTEISIAVRFVYAPGSPESANDGLHYESVIIR